MRFFRISAGLLLVLIATATTGSAAYTQVTTFAGGNGSNAFNTPMGVAVTPSGDLIVADRDHHQIKRVTPAGVVSVIAGSGDAGDTDGAATVARFKAPVAVAYDAPRNIIYVADVRAGLLPLPLLDPSDAIRKIAADGTVSTFLASGLSDPFGLTVDADGNVYVADSGHNRIKKTTPSGTVTTIAGTGQTGSVDGPALQARFNQPNGLAITPSGVLYIADQKNHVIRKLENGVVSTIAGNGSNGWVDGPALSAKFREPRGIAFDADGNLIVADSNNSVIRRITLGANSSVTTIAGNGNAGYVDGPAASAKFREPSGVVVAGTVFVADADNNAIRAIYPTPAITSVTPVRGPLIGGNVVDISGTGFAMGQTQVKFGTVSATAVTVGAATHLTATAPAAISGSVEVIVTTPGGTATLTSAYTYVPPPTIGSVQPAKGATAGGTAVTVSGSGFAAGDTTVSFAAAPATAVSVTASTQLNATTPAATSGLVDVAVTTSGGASSLHNGFRYMLPPSITSFTPASGGAGTPVTVNGQQFDTDPAGNLVKLANQIVTVTSSSATQITFTVPPGSSNGRISVQTAGGTAISATDFSAAAATLRVTSPTAAVAQGASVPFNAVVWSPEGIGTDVTLQATWSSSNVAVASVSSNGTTTATAPGTATITATYGALTASKGVTVDPITVPQIIAPPLDSASVPSFEESVRFLYSGPNAVQLGVASGAIETFRAGTIHGRIRDRAGSAIAGVQVSIADHSELGQTSSRADGSFDLVVNGGGPVTLSMRKRGYIAAQRTANPVWLDQVTMEDVVLVGFDSAVTGITASDGAPQIARGSVMTDASGTRRATMLFFPGTAATMQLPGGGTQSLSTLNVRATEYSVGTDGPRAMPAPLPPQSAYTYCVELSVDEADAAQATSVQFSQPVAIYVENFLGFPVGTAVPLGSYDREKHVWLPAADGRVIRITAIESGAARVDTDGDALADDIGLTVMEREQLGSLYAAGTTLWRCLISHFSPHDMNYPSTVASPDAVLPNGQPLWFPAKENPCGAVGSIIECDNQTLGEDVAVTGTPYALHYRSDRTTGRAASRTIDIPISGAQVPASLLRIELEISIAGTYLKQTFPAIPNQTYRFVWDGRDAYGRLVNGARPITVRTSYVYSGKYEFPPGRGPTFAIASGVRSDVNARAEIPMSQTWTGTLGSWLAQSESLGAWTLTPHHFYDVAGKTLYRGDGSRRTDVPQIFGAPDGVATKIAGTSASDTRPPWSGLGGPATSVRFGYFSYPGFSPSEFAIQGMAVGPDGSVYISFYTYIQKITPDGRLVHVAGNGDNPVGYDMPPPAVAATSPINSAGLFAAQDGSLYVAEPWRGRVRRIDANGIISGVAGGVGLFSPADGPALGVELDYPKDVVVSNDGSVFIAEVDADRVRRVSPDGMITTFAGNGFSGHTGDGGPAVAARLNHPFALALGADGSLYIADGGSIRRVGPDGIISTIAGGGTPGFSGDGGLATAARIANFEPEGSSALTVTPDGSVIFVDNGNNRIRRIDPSGIINTIVGGTTTSPSVYGNPGLATGLHAPLIVAGSPDGTLNYVGGEFEPTIGRIEPSLRPRKVTGDELTVADGDVIYVFNHSGRHLRTLNPDTGAVLLSFSYDNTGLLQSMTDHDGNVTTIERGLASNATAIIAPGGQRTELVAAPYLTSVTTAPGQTTSFTYTADGLMQSMTDARNNGTAFTFNTLGLLVSDQDAEGGVQTLTRTETAGGYDIALSTLSGHTRRYETRNLATDDSTRRVVNASGLASLATFRRDGTTSTTLSDGSVASSTDGGDPVWGLQSSFTKSASLTWPGGQTMAMSTQREAVLSDTENPFSLTTRTDHLTINGKTTLRVFNRSALTDTITSPMGRSAVRTLDVFGSTHRVALPGILPVDMSYDSQGRLQTIVQGTRTQTFGYNAKNELTSVQDSLSRTTRFEYDAAGRVTKQILPDLREIAFGWDVNGNLTSVTPPGRPAHGLGYNKVNLTNAYDPPPLAGTGRTEYTYNVERQLDHIVRPDGSSIGFGYDSGGRLASLSGAGVARSYQYDASGNLGSVGGADATLSYQYDGSTPTQMAWSGAISGTVAWTHDNFGRVANESAGGSAIDYSYNDDGALTQAGEMQVFYWPNTGILDYTIIGDTDPNDWFYFNEFGEMREYGIWYNHREQLVFDYTRDAAGRITAISETTPAVTTQTTYTYDDAGRLMDVASPAAAVHYEYDTNGNRLQRHVTTPSTSIIENATYDQQDRLLTYGGASYSYAPNGELLTKTDTTGTTTYDYDALGNLRHVALPSGMSIDYVIDGQNRRVGRKVNGTLDRTWLYADQTRIVAELDGTGNLIGRFVYGTKTNVPNYMIREGVIYYIFSDHVGSPRVIVNTEANEAVETLTYDEFGNILTDTNPGFTPFGFAGGLNDSLTGLIRFGARDYDPRVGRWTAKDPILFQGGQSDLYAYVMNDPINLTDPAGLAALICNFGKKPIFSSYNNPKGPGQKVFPIGPNSTSASTTGDPDTLIFADGSVVKIPDGSIVIVGDSGRLDTFEQSDLTFLSPLSQWIDKTRLLPKKIGFGPRFIPDPVKEFGPFDTSSCSCPMPVKK
jgi:RHS repeat-associated protein